jgi:hypothetical protein
MKNYFSLLPGLLLVTILGVGVVTAAAGAPVTESLSRSEVAQAQPKLLRITATVDGSGRIVFTRNAVYYEHKHWSEPTDVTFDGEAWNALTETPGSWHYIATHYDLTRACILKRQIAMSSRWNKRRMVSICISATRPMAPPTTKSSFRFRRGRSRELQRCSNRSLVQNDI